MGQPEAHEYATAILDVARHYPVRGLDEKMLAWFNLSQIMVIGYGSRIMMARARGRAARSAGAPRQAPPQPPLRAAPQPNPQAPPPSPMQTAAAPSKNGVIAGVGEVEFPADHPLNPNRGRLQ